MDCLREDQVQGVVEGGLSTSEHAQAHAHLDECTECRELVARVAELLLADSAALAPGAQAEAAPPDADPFPATFRPLKLGELVGRYRVTERLGSGAMGIVYAAEDTTLKRPVALKLLRPGPEGARIDAGRLELEARATCAVHHPNVVTVHDVMTTAGGQSVLVMDLLSGISLRQYLALHGKLSPDVALGVFRQILEALTVAHRMGVVHRDLKPDNVLLIAPDDGSQQDAAKRTDLVVKLVDFGVAKLMHLGLGESPGMTRSGALIGTPYYMAPEQAFGASDVDQRADLWAVGVMLFEALAGARPVRGDNVGQVLLQLAHFDYQGVRGELDAAAPRISTVVAQLLVERKLRLASAEQVLAELCAADQAPLPAPTTAAHLPVASPAPTPPAKPRRWPLALTAAVLAAGALWLTSQAAPSSSATPPTATSGATPAPADPPTAAIAPPPNGAQPPTGAPTAAAALVAPTPLPITLKPSAGARPAHSPATTAAVVAQPVPAQPAPAPKPSAAASAARAPQLLTEPPF